MLFNSLHFLGFFIVTIILGNILKSRIQRAFLLIASFYFYMAWNAYFIALLLISIAIDYTVAIQMNRPGRSESDRKKLLIISLVANLGLLGYFKYTNFFLGLFNDTFPVFYNQIHSVVFPYYTSYINSEAPNSILKGLLHFLVQINTFRFENYEITLPVGISFYTFQSMSYSIDVYRRKSEPRESLLDFALYVSFFPQLVAGPIVRAETFFRDLDNRLDVYKETVQSAVSQIIVGFTRKIVFADNLGIVVDFTFKNHALMNPLEIWTGAIAFGWQIYFDFAGYTDIAIGVARLFGFQFDPNFNFPMVARNITDHWSRWHISFSTWIRDYIFIPLGGSRGSTWMTYRNIYITWLFAGLWHGAAYHYVAWGLWQGIMLTVHREYSKTKVCATLNQKGGKLYDVFARVITMFFLGFGFVMFRAENLTKAFEMNLQMLFLKGNTSIHSWLNFQYGILLMICFVYSYMYSKRPLNTITGKRLTYFLIIYFYLLLLFGVTESQNFLYFAF